MDFLILCGGLVFASWYFGREPKPTKRKDRETLNEVCPNDGTGDFANLPSNDIRF